MKINESDLIVSPPKIDLHIHSNHSDGFFSVQQIIDYAIRVNLKAISITDHDSISALKEANNYCRKKEIEFINGIEISTRMKSCDLHLLGYCFDEKNTDLIEYASFFKNERLKRAEQIVKRLNEIGIKLKFSQVKEFAGSGTIGRPHIAHTMVNLGLAKNYSDVFNFYIGDGCRCFVPKYKISPKEAISLIRNAGGISVLAHPGSETTDEDINILIESGLEGIETIHPRHTQKQVDHFREIISNKGLVETGGSDCHGQYDDDILIGRLNVPYEFVIQMKKKLQR